MKKEYLRGTPRLKSLLFLLVAAIFAVAVASPPEISFASATHASQSHGDMSSAPGEGGGGGAAAGPDRLQAGIPADLEEKIPGPGVFLVALLQMLATASDESEAGIKKLAAGLPRVLPDLNKVLVAL